MDWNEIKAYFQEQPWDSPKKASIYSFLVVLCDLAIEHKVRPPRNFRRSLWQEIVKDARTAVEQENWEYLQVLIDAVGTLNLRDLRMMLRGDTRPALVCKQAGDEIAVYVPSGEFRRMGRRLRDYYRLELQ
jgi:hypothetical protein